MTSLHLILGNKNYSSWSMRPWVLLRQFAIPFTEETIVLCTETAAAEKFARAPVARVPILEHGEVTVWDSLAIVEYLAELFPDKALWPKNLAARARARSLCAEMHAGFMTLRTLMPMNCRARKKAMSPEGDLATDIERLQQMWSTTREEFGAGGVFLFGEFSIADAFYAPVVSRLLTFGIECEGKAAEYANAVAELPCRSGLRWRKAIHT